MSRVWEWIRCSLLGRHKFDVVVVTGSDPDTEDAWMIEMNVCRCCGHLDVEQKR